MKTYVYIRDNGNGYEITAAGEAENNQDAVTAIGRPAEDNEIVGFGDDDQAAFEMALQNTI